jgi:hypothetical protein
MCFPNILNTLVTAIPIHNQLMRQQESIPSAQRGRSSCSPDSVLRLQVVDHAVDIWAVRHLHIDRRRQITSPYVDSDPVSRAGLPEQSCMFVNTQNTCCIAEAACRSSYTGMNRQHSEAPSVGPMARQTCCSTINSVQSRPCR